MTTPVNERADIQTVRIPIIGDMLFRNATASKDQRWVNGYFDVFKNPATNREHYYFTKRAGTSQNIRPSGTSGTGRGVYYWKGAIYSVIGTKIYKNSTDLGVTLTTSTGRCGFQETRPGATTQYLCVNDGVKLFCIATSGAVTTVTVNFPTPNTTDIVYFDTYMFVLDANGNLFNSAVDDPTSWSASNYITSQMYNSIGVGLAHQNNYVIVFGDGHFQMFYDNANASGSPMNNSDILVQQLGCAAQPSIVSSSTTTVWVGNKKVGGFSVYRIDGVTKADRCSTDAIDRILTLEGSSISAANAYQIKISGHDFYILNLTSSNRTFVYDMDTNIWFEWEIATGGTAWPIVSAVQGAAGPIVQHTTNGWIYNLADTVYQDDSVNFTVLARFGRIDFEDNRRKFVQRVELIGDVQATSALALLQYSDDDYVTLSTARSIDMSFVRQYAPAMGNFRRRSYQLSYTGNTPCRWEALDLRIRMGD